MLLIIAAAALIYILSRSQTLPPDSSSPLYSPGDIIDYRRCSLLEPLRIYVHPFDHPLAAALSIHPAATRNRHDACLFIVFTDKNNPWEPFSWNYFAEPGLNHVLINVDADMTIGPEGGEMIVQANYEKGTFRPLIDFFLSLDVDEFDSNEWMKRPSLNSPKTTDCSLVVDLFLDSENSGISQVQCHDGCVNGLLSTTFCLLLPSITFHSRLLDSLRAGCIPVILSTSQPLPFEDHLDWRQASFRFPQAMAAHVPKKLGEIDSASLMEMRRRGRVFLSRINDANALSKSLVAALSERIHMALPFSPEVSSQVITPSGIFKNSSDLNRIPSRFDSKRLSASRLYSRVRWNSGRDLTYTPRTLHDAHQLPSAEYANDEDILMNLDSYEEQQFTAMILVDNDESATIAIENLRNFPYLNKIIVVWANRDCLPKITGLEVHVPIEFIRSESNSLNNRFLPYEFIETEAIVTIYNFENIDNSEFALAFQLWKNNRDTIVTVPESFGFFHKEFMFEYSYNQHSAILDHVKKIGNCEDLAMIYLISHLTGKPPIIVDSRIRKYGDNSSQQDQFEVRENCMRMFEELYGIQSFQSAESEEFSTNLPIFDR